MPVTETKASRKLSGIDLLKLWRIERGSRSWLEYNQAKNLFLRNQYPGIEYQEFVAALVEWLRL